MLESKKGRVLQHGRLATVFARGGELDLLPGGCAGGAVEWLVAAASVYSTMLRWFCLDTVPRPPVLPHPSVVCAAALLGEGGVGVHV